MKSISFVCAVIVVALVSFFALRPDVARKAYGFVPTAVAQAAAQEAANHLMTFQKSRPTFNGYNHYTSKVCIVLRLAWDDTSDRYFHFSPDHPDYELLSSLNGSEGIDLTYEEKPVVPGQDQNPTSYLRVVAIP